MARHHLESPGTPLDLPMPGMWGTMSLYSTDVAPRHPRVEGCRLRGKDSPRAGTLCSLACMRTRQVRPLSVGSGSVSRLGLFVDWTEPPPCRLDSHCQSSMEHRPLPWLPRAMQRPQHLSHLCRSHHPPSLRCLGASLGPPWWCLAPQRGCSQEGSGPGMHACMDLH